MYPASIGGFSLAEPVPLRPLSEDHAPEPTPTSMGARITVALPALGYRDFRIFWFGQMVSLTGTWVQSVAQQWLVLDLTGSAFKLGLVTTVQFTPLLLLSLFGGAIVDRVSKRNVLLITQIVSGLLALGLGMLVQTGAVRYWHVLVFAAVLGTVNAFYTPARQAFVPELVDRDTLRNAIALNSAIFNGARVIGPAVGGLLVAGIGLAPNFYLNAASYVAVIGSLLLIQPKPVDVDVDRGRLIDSVGEGLRYIQRTPVVATILALIGVSSLFALNFSVLLPILSRTTLHVGSAGYGFLMGAWGVGSLVSAILLAFLKREDLARSMIYVGAAVFGIAEIGVALSRVYALSIVLMVVVGFFVTIFTTTANTRVLSITPSELQGRVMSVYSLMFLGVTPFGSLFAGTVAQHFGPAAGLASGAVIMLAFTAGIFLFRRSHTATA